MSEVEEIAIDIDISPFEEPETTLGETLGKVLASVGRVCTPTPIQSRSSLSWEL